MPSAASTAGGLALGGTRGTHPALRLDSFLRSTDAGYQHAEVAVQGDHFIRKMATYGQVRPSVSFTSGPRVSRPVKDCSVVDMSNLPPPWMDPRGDAREGTLAVPAPPREPNTEFVKLYQNKSLMLPSERYREHILMKQLERQWHEDREAIFNYKKRMRILERKHAEGVLGVDGPLFPNTKLYAERHAQLAAQADQKALHAEMRGANLAELVRADDATAFRHYASDPGLARSQDVCIQRKRVDPEVHPYRFVNTHERLFPVYTPVWDPERAQALRSHDVRDRQYNILSGDNNSLTYEVARRWDDPAPRKTGVRQHDVLETEFTL